MKQNRHERSGCIMTQCEKILNHMQTIGGISAYDAVMKYGITRLSARIYDLRKDGHHIVSDTIKTKNRDGKPCQYEVFRLEQSE